MDRFYGYCFIVMTAGATWLLFAVTKLFPDTYDRATWLGLGSTIVLFIGFAGALTFVVELGYSKSTGNIARLIFYAMLFLTGFIGIILYDAFGGSTIVLALVLLFLGVSVTVLLLNDWFQSKVRLVFDWAHDEFYYTKVAMFGDDVTYTKRLNKEAVQ